MKFSGSRLGWLLLTFSRSVIRQFLELKTSCYSVNLWRANLFFSYSFSCAICVFNFFCVGEVLTFLFDLFFHNKITNFHFGSSSQFVFDNFFLNLNAPLVFFLLVRLL